MDNFIDAPMKGIRELTLLSTEERLKGRPKICSDCGLCDTSYKPLMPRVCTFVNNTDEAIEQRMFGRRRESDDELLFGIFRSMHIARLPNPREGVQASGIITTLAAMLLAQGEVEGVITTRAVEGTRFAPQPFIARTPEEVLDSCGNKPCLSPNLGVLDELKASGMKRVLFIGTGCQVHMLRAIEKELGLEKLYVIGIPCTDNVTYPDLLRFLKVASKSPETVVHFEFMQDYSVWLKHEDGHIERTNYVDMNPDSLGQIFPSACLSCFDYINSLSDITVGYLGAPVGWQWVLVRTAIGEELFAKIAPQLQQQALIDEGERQKGVESYMRRSIKPTVMPPALMRKFIAFMQRRTGPKGLTFARWAVEFKLIRNLNYVREKFPNHEKRVVPYHVYESLARYSEAYKQTYGRELM
jgi:coenzyme F420 hydrogenase subunit beta